MASTIKPRLPTLHHLNDSQGQRVLWLLEELGIEYNLVLYKRIDGRSPPELKKIHFMGKAPILVTADNRAIIESSAIITYLLQTYDTTGRFKASDPLRDEILTSFSGATIQPVGLIQLIFGIVAEKAPWPISSLLGAVKGQIFKTFTGPEFALQFEYLEKELGGDDWFNGKELGRSDVMLSFPLDMIAARKWMDFSKYPKLEQWRKRVQDRDAWKRGMEKGNGYDMSRA